ncbi:MAG: Gfo/Idh/MocA family protein [Daejeonella sp.]
MKRRDFLQKTVLTTGGIGLAGAFPWIVRGGVKKLNPSDKIKVALIGARNMGWANLEQFIQFPNVECIAICDVDDKWVYQRAADVEKITGKKPPFLYKDWRKVMENKDVDAVIVGTPDHWHCLITIAAIEAGKDVYCEKPLGNSIAECEVMLKAARAHNRVVQVGQWQRSDPHWHDAMAFIRSGQLGHVRSVKTWATAVNQGPFPVQPDSHVPPGVDYDMWLGPARHRPFNQLRFHHEWRFFWDYGSGLASDWGVHLLDFALEGMQVGLPDRVYSSGGKFAYPNDAMETPDTLTSVFKYDRFNIIWDHACGISNGLFNRGFGVAYVGEKGTLVVDRGGWEVIPGTGVDGKPRMEAVTLKKVGYSVDGIKLPEYGLKAHVHNFLDCMGSRQLPNADIAIGARIAKLCQFINISHRVNKPVHWDSKSNRFAEADANLLIKPKYRSPWVFPKY